MNKEVTVMKINPGEYSFVSGAECGVALYELCENINNKEDVTVIFNKGNYIISSENCHEISCAITNTASPDEYKDKTQVNRHKVAFHFENIKNLTFDCCDSEFIIDGKMTNIIISGCENVMIKNIKIKTKNPNLHKFTVIKTNLFNTVFKLNKESEYIKENGKFYFVGKGYRFGFTETAQLSSWNIVNNPDNENAVIRGFHPFKGAVSIKELSENIFSVRYALPKKFTLGQSFHIYDCLRSDVGIFVENSKNITFENLTQNFNYSLALVAQCCENINVHGCCFEPEKDSELDVASLADFMQLCMCSGKISVRNCNFEGAGDDAINVHGVHFAVEKINKSSFDAVFSHPQTWGFNPFEKGDKIEFIDPKTLLSVDEAVVISSQLVSDKVIRITVDRDIPGAYDKYVIENITKCPSLKYINNTINKVVTRGILYTSRGECVIKNNTFRNTGMSSILLSDDAEKWFESGMCKSVLIENNIFEETGKNAILILPENKINGGFVHSNIKIVGNKFRKFEDECIFIKSTDKIEIKRNIFASGEKLKTVNCRDVNCDF